MQQSVENSEDLHFYGINVFFIWKTLTMALDADRLLTFKKLVIVLIT